jgi:hypothetical protein
MILQQAVLFKTNIVNSTTFLQTVKGSARIHSALESLEVTFEERWHTVRGAVRI